VSHSDLPKISRNRKSLAQWVLSAVAGLLAATLVITVTQSPGPGIDPDSASYVGAAVSVARGQGYTVPVSDWATPDSTTPLSHFPPAYSTAIALPITLGVPPSQSARFVNAAAAFVDLAIVTLLVARAAGLATAAITALAILVMRPFVLAHLSLLSEPLFLADMMAAFAAMIAVATSPHEPQRLRRALLAGAIGALATLTRYAGIAIGAAVALWMLILPGTLATRIRRAVAALIPQIVLTGAWIVHVRLTSGAHGIRTPGVYGGLGATIRMGAATSVAWLIPLSADQSLPGRRWIALLFALALILTVIRGARLAGPLARTTIAAALMMAVCYALVLVAARFLADPGVPFDERILIPIFLLATIVVALAAHATWSHAQRPLRAASGVAVLAWLLASGSASFDEASAALDTGVDFAQDEWRLSPMLTWVRENAPRRPLFTNWPAVVLFHLGRASHELPEVNDTLALRAFGDTLRARGGVVLVFDQRNPDFIGPEEMLRAPGLRRVASFPDGGIFAPAP
jgi:hypothetical protein